MYYRMSTTSSETLITRTTEPQTTETQHHRARVVITTNNGSMSVYINTDEARALVSELCVAIDQAERADLYWALFTTHENPARLMDSD